MSGLTAARQVVTSPPKRFWSYSGKTRKVGRFCPPPSGARVKGLVKAFSEFKMTSRKSIGHYSPGVTINAWVSRKIFGILDICRQYLLIEPKLVNFRHDRIPRNGRKHLESVLRTRGWVRHDCLLGTRIFLEKKTSVST